MVVNKNLEIPSVRELFQSIRTIRRDWKSKTPLQKFCYFYGVGRASCIIPAVPIFEDQQTLTIWSYQGYVYIAIYSALGVYTVNYHIVRDEFLKILPCTCLLSFILAVSFQLNCILFSIREEEFSLVIIVYLFSRYHF